MGKKVETHEPCFMNQSYPQLATSCALARYYAVLFWLAPAHTPKPPLHVERAVSFVMLMN